MFSGAACTDKFNISSESTPPSPPTGQKQWGGGGGTRFPRPERTPRRLRRRGHSPFLYAFPIPTLESSKTSPQISGRAKRPKGGLTRFPDPGNPPERKKGGLTLGGGGDFELLLPPPFIPHLFSQK